MTHAIPTVQTKPHAPALRKNGLESLAEPDLSGVLAALRMFLLPLSSSLARSALFDAHWAPGGPWLPAAVAYQ